MMRGAAALLVLLCFGCAPYYAWGDPKHVEKRLLELVPPGSSPADLQATASRRRWKINKLNTRRWDAGPTYFHDHDTDCRSLAGGLVVPAIVASYPTPFETTVETLWIFDARDRLSRVCVRKTTDAL